MKKKLPIGVSDFKELIERDYYYVDKTLLIKELHESGDVILLPRPRRFGKTINLSMLHYFYEKNEHSTKHLFESYAIWHHEKYRELQGQFPVIFLSFKSVNYPTFEASCEKIAALLAIEFNRHNYLLKGATLEPYEKELFNKIRQKKATEVELTDSLEYLSHLLHRFYQKNVIILIDECAPQTRIKGVYHDDKLTIYA